MPEARFFVEKKVDAVVFDFDGLMFNSQDLYVATGIKMLERRKKILCDDLLDLMMGKTARDAMRAMKKWHELDDSVEQLVTEAQETLAPMIETKIRPLPGLRELVSLLSKNRVPMAVASSSSKQMLTRILSQFDFLESMQFVLGSEDVEKGKPFPDIYLLATKRLAVDQSRAVAFEDSGVGCESASHAGLQVIAIPSTYTINDSFESALFLSKSLLDSKIYDHLGLSRNDE